jgi:hypothetical protein
MTMTTTRIRFSALLGLAVLAAPAFALAQSAPVQPGQRMQLGPMMGDRVLRQVMVNDDSSVTLVYDMRPGLPQSQRVLRLENVNGMLEVIYDTATPTMRVGNDGAVPRLAVGSGNMIEVQYDRK